MYKWNEGRQPLIKMRLLNGQETVMSVNWCQLCELQKQGNTTCSLAFVIHASGFLLRWFAIVRVISGKRNLINIDIEFSSFHQINDGGTRYSDARNSDTRYSDTR